MENFSALKKCWTWAGSQSFLLQWVCIQQAPGKSKGLCSSALGMQDENTRRSLAEVPALKGARFPRAPDSQGEEHLSVRMIPRAEANGPYSPPRPQRLRLEGNCSSFRPSASFLLFWFYSYCFLLIEKEFLFIISNCILLFILSIVYCTLYFSQFCKDSLFLSLFEEPVLIFTGIFSYSLLNF